MTSRVACRSRRSFLASLGVGTGVGLAGCVDTLFGNTRFESDELEVTVKTLPADEDPPAAEVARRLTEHLVAIGADATLEPQTGEVLFEDVLVEHSFDIVVAQYPGLADPDELRPMLHSRFRDEPGWQNPFGLAEPAVDDLLERQRTVEGAAREELLYEIQAAILEHVPFATVAVPDELSALRNDLPELSRPIGLSGPMDVLIFGDSTEPMESLRVGLLDGRITVNRNPLTPAFPKQSLVTGLVYDPLVRLIDGTYRPWAASGMVWDEDNDRPRIELSLPGAYAWHDGEPVTAADVVFTVDYLRDLTLGTAPDPFPAPRYRGRISSIDGVTAIDERTLAVTFDPISRDLALRSLTVPILPKHRWETITGFEDGRPAALDEPNRPTIGSGPMVVGETDPGERLVLERNEQHPQLLAASMREPPEPVLAVNRLELEVPTRPPTMGTLVDLLADGDLDVVSRVPAHEAATVIRSPGASLSIRPSTEFYLIGFNLREGPGVDPAFRRLVGRLIDRTFVVASVFRGFAQAADSPLVNTPYLDPGVAWEGESHLGPFPGTSGILDEEAARRLFSEAGFEYDDQGNILAIERDGD